MKIKYKRRRKKIPTLYLIMLLTLLLCITSVGYAKWSTQLSIDGNITLSKKAESYQRKRTYY